MTLAAERLNALGLIPEKIGRPKSELRAFFQHLCSNQEHGDITDAGTAMDDAIELLKANANKLVLLIDFATQGNRFALARRDLTQNKDIVLEGIDIDTTADFLVPTDAAAEQTDTVRI